MCIEITLKDIIFPGLDLSELPTIMAGWSVD